MNACVKAVSEMLGVIQLWEELFDQKLQATLLVDSSACRGMMLRAGAGRVKHLSTKQLWVQSAVEVTPIAVEKIPRQRNCADMLTHCLGQQEAGSQLRTIGFRWD